MSNYFPWLVYEENPYFLYRDIIWLRTRTEAQNYAKGMNQLTSSLKYKVCFDEQQVVQVNNHE